MHERQFSLAKFAGTAAIVAVVGLPITTACSQSDGSLSNQQRDEIRGLVREYILENPEIISEAILALQEKEEQARSKQQADALKRHAPALFTPDENTIVGNPKGEIILVEFFDYNCGYCKSMYPAVKDVLEENDDVKMVMKEFPILGPGSLAASRAALASREQGKYPEMHVAMLSHRGSLNESTIMSIAENIGLDVEKLQQDMKDPKINDVLSKNMALAQDLGIDGTPGLIIGDTIVPGAIGKDRIVDLIEDARR